MVSFSFAQDKQWTLQECVTYALENNISVQQTEYNTLTSEENLVASRGQFLPSLGASYSQSISFGNAELFPGSFVDRTFHSSSASINVSQTVFNGFRTTNLYKQSKLNLEQSKLELEKIKDDITLNVVNSYLNVLFNKENLNTAIFQLDFSEKQLNRVKELVDSGVSAKGDLLNIEATLANDEQTVVAAENNLNLAKLSLAQLLQISSEGFDVINVVVDEPSTTLLYADSNSIYDIAATERNEIKSAEKAIEVSELGTVISKGGYLPTLSFSYGFNSGANFSNLSSSNSFVQQMNDNKGHNLSLRLSVPIFSRFQNKTSVSKSKIQEEKAKLNLEQAKLTLYANIERAFLDVKAALKSHEAAKKSLAAQELSLENTQGRFSIGMANAFDLDQERTKLVNAKASLTKAKYDFVFKSKVLDFYAGKSLVD
jgi:outer membrane protein